MVHLGGQKHGTGIRDRGPGTASRRHAVPLIAALTLYFMTMTTPASAQAAIGFHGGVAVDPEQVFGGVFFQTGDIGRGIRLRPGIDGGAGDGLRVATIGVDFVYGYPLGANGWTLLAGGGPAVVITRIPDFDFRDTGVGFHSLIGFGHDSGFFTELRLGSGRAQQLKLGVGWAITLN
jgi:hypothetical protein